LTTAQAPSRATDNQSIALPWEQLPQAIQLASTGFGSRRLSLIRVDRRARKGATHKPRNLGSALVLNDIAAHRSPSSAPAPLLECSYMGAAPNCGQARLSRAVVSLAARRARFPFTTREEWPLQRKAVPVAPRGAPGPVLQDRNMALTWPIGAPGSAPGSRAWQDSNPRPRCLEGTVRRSPGGARCGLTCCLAALMEADCSLT
jgi:hypothetical protein